MAPRSENKCLACGGYDFSLSDGFMYCTACGSLLENFEELEMEDEMNTINAKGKIHVKRATPKKIGGEENGDEEGPRRKFSQHKTNIASMNDRAKRTSNFFVDQIHPPNLPPTETSPDYLYTAGLRIATASRILARSSHILVHEMNFPDSYSENVLALFQKYLEHCQIAFCSNELSDSIEQQFVAVLENTKFSAQEKAAKNLRLEKRKTEGKRKLNKSAAAWQLLTQGNLTENLEMAFSSESEPEGSGDDDDEDENEDETQIDMDDTREETLGVVRQISTFLNKEAVRRCVQIRLNLEYLIAILYVSALACGCKNVFVSDFVRWAREDRFRISHQETRLLLRSGDEKLVPKLNQGEPATYMDWHEMELKLPLFEVQLCILLFSQSLELEKSVTEASFAKLAARMVDNLNLPHEILRRVILIEAMNPCDISVCSRRQVDCNNGYDLEKLTAMLPKMQFDKYWERFGRNERTSISAQEVVLSNETKIMAHILFAIKMTIDLEKQEVEKDDTGSVFFNIDTWMHQLEMRIMCWQGHDMSKVLSQSCPVPTMTSEMPFGNNVLRCKTRFDYQYNVLRTERNPIGFRSCIPSKMSFNSTQNLPTVFATRAARAKKEWKNLPDAHLAPLKFQRKVLRKEMNENEDLFSNCDEESVATFFESFSICTLVESAENATEFVDIFPGSAKYVKNGEYRAYLSAKTCEDLFDCAIDSFPERFRFLLESFALMIGEDIKVLYAAFVMLEMHFLEANRISSIRECIMNRRMFSFKAAQLMMGRIHEVQATSIPGAISKIDEAHFFTVSAEVIFPDEVKDSKVELSDSENEEGGGLETDPDDLDDDDERRDQRLDFYMKKLRESREQFKDEISEILAKKEKYRYPECDRTRQYPRYYEFETMFAIFAIRYW